ncbi:hypothetical protein F3Y22_tig00111166pilonHSYRG00136 [Hibiscus syriacus]|uniref:Ubiquitin-like domain-containing protein n=1 Tax=Hibiscus syriacus TaxID=106335 RepID=A0A6A2YWY7_HIBSY|nr:hypothetical protein F3Y22_tig00111166pilonHSYRG00136 [Hibiscus syriacus]
MRVLESESIASVKLRIQTSEGFAVKNQKLVCGGRELTRNDSLLKDYGVKGGNVLHLILKLSDLLLITVRTSCGEELELHVNRNRNIGYLKQRIARKAWFSELDQLANQSCYRFIGSIGRIGLIEPLSGFKLSYQRKGKVYLLTDNEDVERFIVYISVSQDDITLYVVEPRSSEVGSVAGSNQLSFSTPVYGAQNLMVPPQFHHQANFVSPHFQYQTQSQNPQPFPNPNPNQLSAPNFGFRINQLDDDEPTEKIVSTSRYSKFDLGQYPDFDLATAKEDVIDDNEEEVTTVNEHVEHPFCNSYNLKKKKKKKKSSKKSPRIKCHGSITGICQNYFRYQKKSWVYRGHKIMTNMNARFKISISYSQAWRAKCYALELLRGSPKASFAQLPAYCHNLKLKNPGSVTHIKIDRDGRFELLFIAIGAMIRSFITCMRPVIIVDRAHLKGRYLGVNLLAVAMDVNNGILPIAYGVDKSETSNSWTWFMGHLRDCIGPISNLTIISDRANSIDNAVRSAYAMDCYTTEVYRQTYAEIIYHIPHPSEWDIPYDLQTVLPPAMDRRLPGRPKSHDRIPSKGKEKKRSICSRCKESGHTRLTCGSPVPS